MTIVLIASIIVYYLAIYFLLRKTLRIFKISSRFPIVLYLIILSLPIFCIIDYIYRGIKVIEALAIIGYLIAAFLIYYLVVLGIFILIKKLYNMIYKDYFLYTKVGIIVSASISVLVCVFGVISAQSPKRVVENIECVNGDFKIVAVSDLHYASTGSMLSLEKMVNQINKEQPDVVLFIGDVFDNKIERFNRDRFFSFIDNIECKYGIYAITGNHEFFHNTLEEIRLFYQESKVKLLLDREVIIANKVRIIGRIDSSQNRKNLDEISLEEDYPLVVLDHQPQNYKDAVNNHAVLQISGHTHNGQIFPGNLLVGLYNKLLYDSPIDGIHNYDYTTLAITKGYGTWGFPMRTTGRSEVMIFNL